MASSSCAQMLGLHRVMMKEGKHLSTYNYRMFIVKRVSYVFWENKSIKGPVEIQTLESKAKETLK